MIFREPCLVLLFFCYFSVFVDSLRTRIIKTAIIHFAPSIKQHHIVIVEKYNRILCAVDFSPINQSDLRTLADLVLGRDVPAEVRVKNIIGVDFYDDDGIVDQWLLGSSIASGSLSTTFPELRTWNGTTLNLYTHNCQHFSAFMSGSYYNNKIR
jgi:hypothetical protein